MFQNIRENFIAIKDASQKIAFSIRTLAKFQRYFNFSISFNFS